MLIPRTAIFLRRGESFLLLRGSPSKRLWAGKYNGLGGHVERGEDVLSSGRRELLEESGLEAELWLSGTVVIDAGPTGVCLFILTGEVRGGSLRSSSEGTPEWIAFSDVGSLPTVEDLPALLARIYGMKRGDVPFSARSFYDEEGRLVVRFDDADASSK